MDSEVANISSGKKNKDDMNKLLEEQDKDAENNETMEEIDDGEEKQDDEHQEKHVSCKLDF